jgi:hypothetical protein
MNRAFATVGTLMLLSLALMTAGCSHAASQAAQQNPASLTTADQAAVRTAAVAVLEDLNFQVQTPSPSPQEIETLPLVSAYPLEFWRKDVRTSADRAESAIHTMRRTVKVLLDSGRGQTTVEVIVHRERLSLPDAVNAKSAVEAYAVFADSRTYQEVAEQHWGRGEAWMDCGRDPALEQYILEQLVRRL